MRKAQELYDKFILSVMKDKKIEFVPEVFYKIANLLGPIYIKTDKQKKENLNNTIWEKKRKEVDYSSTINKIKNLYNEPFFKVNNEIWTVKDFVDQANIHPLIFRKKRMKAIEFGQQLQFAIMDMIRDKYLTEEAYRREYDKINLVQRNVNMWKDNINYIYYKEKYLKSVLPDSASNLSYLMVLENYLNHFVDSLQNKYSSVIKIDVDKYNQIELTRIDMNVNYYNEAYSRVVPSFPIVTTDNKLNYGSKMTEDKLN